MAFKRTIAFGLILTVGWICFGSGKEVLTQPEQVHISYGGSGFHQFFLDYCNLRPRDVLSMDYLIAYVWTLRQSAARAPSLNDAHPPLVLLG